MKKKDVSSVKFDTSEISNGNVKCNKTYEKLINIEIEKNEITNSAIALFLIIFNNIVFDI